MRRGYVYNLTDWSGGTSLPGSRSTIGSDQGSVEEPNPTPQLQAPRHLFGIRTHTILTKPLQSWSCWRYVEELGVLRSEWLGVRDDFRNWLICAA